MGWKLPKLTTDVDCAPIGYPGLVVTFVLNPGYDDHKWPWSDVTESDDPEAAYRAFAQAAKKDAASLTDAEKKQAIVDQARARVLEAEPWQAEYYYYQARIIDHVTFPPGLTDNGKGLVVALEDARAVYDLQFAPGFDQSILIWPQGQYDKQRQERLNAESKN